MVTVARTARPPDLAARVRACVAAITRIALRVTSFGDHLVLGTAPNNRSTPPRIA